MSTVYREIERGLRRAVTSIRQGFRGRVVYVEPQFPVQLAQMTGLADELLSRVEVMQQFGMTSGLPPDTDCIVLPLGGRTDHSIIVATEHASFRVKVEAGETCVYNQWGAKITFKKERLIEVECDEFVLNAKNSVTINTKEIRENASVSAGYSSPSLSFEGKDGAPATAKIRADIRQEGNHFSTGDQVAGGISQISHVHVCPECGTTGAPRS